MRQEDRRLADLCQALRVQVGDQDRQRNRDHDVEHDEHDVVADRVAEHRDRRLHVRGEQELEVVQPAPGAVVDQAPQKALARRNLVLLEGDQYAEHRDIAEKQIPDRRGQGQRKQLQIVHPDLAALLFLLLYGHRLRPVHTGPPPSVHLRMEVSLDRLACIILYGIYVLIITPGNDLSR